MAPRQQQLIDEAAADNDSVRKRRSSSAARAPRPDESNDVQDSGRKGGRSKRALAPLPSLQRRSTPASAAEASSSTVCVMGFPDEFLFRGASPLKGQTPFDLWNRVVKYESEGADDSSGPFYIAWPFRGLGADTALPTLEALYAQLIKPWNDAYPSGEGEARASKSLIIHPASPFRPCVPASGNFAAESVQVRAIGGSHPSGAAKRTSAWLQLGQAGFKSRVQAMYGELPWQLEHMLRMDMFGNVVAKEVGRRMGDLSPLLKCSQPLR